MSDQGNYSLKIFIFFLCKSIKKKKFIFYEIRFQDKKMNLNFSKFICNKIYLNLFIQAVIRCHKYRCVGINFLVN